MATARDSFKTQTKLQVGEKSYTIFSLPALEKQGFNILRLPYVVKILLENLLRREDGISVAKADIEALARFDPTRPEDREIAFLPARVLLQDFTGVPALVDLATMRDAFQKLGGSPGRISPIFPAELVIDHSIQVDAFGVPGAMSINADRDYERNRERYAFLRWGQQAFQNFKVVPPNTGIVHQVNLEYLARVVFETAVGEDTIAYPDTLVGTDSHTPMINGLGVLGWGVGGIEAEAALLGQPIPLTIPVVVGVQLKGRMQEGVVATDLVLTVAEMLRRHGVVGKFVEFFGEGTQSLTIADRATLGNMSPEYGATCAIFPIDEATLEYLRLTGRREDRVALVEAYAKAQGLFHTKDTPHPKYNETLELDLGTIVPCVAGPRLPHQLVPLPKVKQSFYSALEDHLKPHEKAGNRATARWEEEGGHQISPAPNMRGSLVEGETSYELKDGSVVIAAITSCTNTSNPAVMLGAGILAKKALERGLRQKPWVKTSLAPGSMVVMDYLKNADLVEPLEKLGFGLVGYGCTTCIGNSGPLPEPVAKAIEKEKLYVCSVLSGNRNYEGRINPLTLANYLASPPLVVAYAIAGRVDVDLTQEPLGEDRAGIPVYLKDVWPTTREIADAAARAINPKIFQEKYAHLEKGDERWTNLPIPEGELYRWDADSTYIKQPPYFVGMSKKIGLIKDIVGARVLALLGDAVTTDHISPAGTIHPNSPAGQYLVSKGVKPADFNTYGARRGNHEVMIRGTFANIRLKNLLVPGKEGGFTRHFPEGMEMTIYDAAMRYQKESIPLVIIAGKEYGSGSSRDWAAKGTRLLGIHAVIAESYERIHRSNLIGMGVLPLQFLPGENAKNLNLTGEEVFDIKGISALKPKATLTVHAVSREGTEKNFQVIARIDTPVELGYFQNGGILYFVLRDLLNQK